MIPLKRFIHFFILLTLFFLFFIGGPDYYSPRSYKSFWNLGHILFFSLFPLLFLFHKRISNSYLIQCILAFALAVILGAIIELVQTEFKRIPDAYDLFRDIIGAMVCIFFLLPLRKAISKSILLIMQTITVVFISMQIVPIVIDFADEYIARKQFPVLSSFETPFEIQRWSGETDFIVTERIKLTGKASMKVSLSANMYSGVELLYFPKDWEGFNYFQFAVFNPSSEDISITCRIYDKKHIELGKRYEDRFNRTFSIPQGWNTFTIKLKKIKHAPINRKMNMKEISNIFFFTNRVPYPKIIYIDDVKLLL